LELLDVSLEGLGTIEQYSRRTFPLVLLPFFGVALFGVALLPVDGRPALFVLAAADFRAPFAIVMITQLLKPSLKS